MKLIPRDFDLFTSPFENWHSLMNFKNTLENFLVSTVKEQLRPQMILEYGFQDSLEVVNHTF